MRTTITFSADVAAAIEQHRRQKSIGLSEVVNDLVRAGLTADRPSTRFAQTSHDLGFGIDVANVGDALETLDGPSAR